MATIEEIRAELGRINAVTTEIADDCCAARPVWICSKSCLTLRKSAGR